MVTIIVSWLQANNGAFNIARYGMDSTYVTANITQLRLKRSYLFARLLFSDYASL
jgi:hypothetical protein